MRNTMIKKLLLNQGKYETVEGIPPLTLEKSLGKDLKDYKIYGNSIQNGTPTPDTPVEVESVGEYDEITGKYKIPIISSASGETIETNIYLDEPLRKAGEIADYIDFENGVVIRNIKSTRLLSSYVGGLSGATTSSTKIVTITPNNDFAKAKTSYATGFCNIGKVSYMHAERDSGVVYWAYNTNATTFFAVPNKILKGLGFTSDEQGIKDFIDYQNGISPIVIDFVLKTPTETQIELPKLPTLKGTTVLDTNTNLALSNMSVVYKRR